MCVRHFPSPAVQFAGLLGPSPAVALSGPHPQERSKISRRPGFCRCLTAHVYKTTFLIDYNAMAIELKIPSVGESVTEVEIGQWLKSEGDAVAKDENVVTLESEKASVDLPSPADGTLGKIVKRTGEKAAIGEIICYIEPGQKPSTESRPARKAEKSAPPTSSASPAPAPAVPAAVATPVSQPAKATAPPPLAPKEVRAESEPSPAPPPQPAASGRRDDVIRMTPLRRAVARRLVEASQAMAMLTTFNEIDMSAVIALRKECQENFTRKHGVKLGFMSFFVKASVEALKVFPQLNASIQGEDIRSIIIILTSASQSAAAKASSSQPFATPAR